MKVTLIRDLRDGYYYVQVDEPDGKTADIGVKIVAGVPTKLRWETTAAIAVVSSWLGSVGLRPNSFKSIFPEEKRQ